MAIQGEGSLFTLIRCEDSAAWLEERRRGIGGSDVAAIMGLSPWRTPAEVWLEKTGRAEPEDISGRPNVVFGNVMEPVIGRWYATRYPDRRVRRVNAICQSIGRPWARASLDYEVRDGDRWGVLEIKTARDARDWQDGAPPYYLTQVTHYMAVTGRAFADVAVLFRDEAEFRCYRYERDEEDVAAVTNAVDDFWHGFVEADVLPALVGTDGEARGLTGWYGVASADSITLNDPETLQLISDYQDASERERRAREDKRTASTRLMARIGEHKALFTDTSKVTWVRSEQERIDTRQLRSDHPDLAARYTSKYVKNGGLRVTDLKQ